MNFKFNDERLNKAKKEFITIQEKIAEIKTPQIHDLILDNYNKFMSVMVKYDGLNSASYYKLGGKKTSIKGEPATIDDIIRYCCSTINFTLNCLNPIRPVKENVEQLKYMDNQLKSYFKIIENVNYAEGGLKW